MTQLFTEHYIFSGQDRHQIPDQLLMKRAGCRTHFEYTLYIHLENLTVCHSHYTDRTSSHARTCAAGMGSWITGKVSSGLFDIPLLEMYHSDEKRCQKKSGGNEESADHGSSGKSAKQSIHVSINQIIR